MINDVSRAYFYAKCTRDLYVELPAEDPEAHPDFIGKLRKYQSITSHHIIYKLEQFTFEDVVVSNIEGLKERGERRRNKQEDQHRMCSFDPLHQAGIPMRRVHVQNKHVFDGLAI